MLESYLTNSSSDNKYQKLILLEAFELTKHKEDEKFMKHLETRKLLWHGSRITNFVGILSQGLRIAPPEAPSSGYLFGKGVYFADMASKSSSYCYPTNKIGLILLCDVALGDMKEYSDINRNAASQLGGKHSTKGIGQTIPDPSEEKVCDNVTIPLGKPIKNKTKCYLSHNEYIVYNTDQVKMKYLLKIRFDNK